MFLAFTLIVTPTAGGRKWGSLDRERLPARVGGARRRANTFLKLGDNAAITEANLSVVGWNDHELYTQRIRNCSGKAIDLEIRRPFDGHVIFRSGLNPNLHDYRTVEINATVPPGERADIMFEIVRRQVHNATQNNVTLEAAVVP